MIDVIRLSAQSVVVLALLNHAREKLIKTERENLDHIHNYMRANVLLSLSEPL